MHAVKGMVLVEGVTYRIVRTAQAEYAVVRVLDDLTVGMFRNAPRIEVTSAAIEPKLMREVARMAIQGAKTSWVGRLGLSEAASS